MTKKKRKAKRKAYSTPSIATERVVGTSGDQVFGGQPRCPVAENADRCEMPADHDGPHVIFTREGIVVIAQR